MSKEGRIALGGLAAIFIWSFVILPFYYSPYDSAAQQCSAKGNEYYSFWEKARCDPIAYFTGWLVGFTGVLAFSTIGLWVVTWRASKRQSRETEILQRAYISIDAIGFEPFRSDPQNWGDARIKITNVGKLPARKVSWAACRKFSRKIDLEWLPINETRMGGNSVIPPGAEIIKGTLRISARRFERFKQGMGTRDRFLYVWGLVRYEDGFENMRFTRFCHRYNVAAETDLNIAGIDARHHEYGNDAD
jgi:hypothetical protein